MKAFEIYAGCGGIATGLREAGFEHKILIDCDARCIETLSANGFSNTLHARVEYVDFRPFKGVDLLCGGIPCAPWSIAGLDTGVADERNGSRLGGCNTSGAALYTEGCVLRVRRWTAERQI